MSSTPQHRRLSFLTMASFGSGQIAEGVMYATFHGFVIYYYQQVLEVSGALTGLALGIALVFDAVTDPLAGVMSDRLNSRWGRRHPFMLTAALPLGITFWLLFNPPTGMNEIGYFVWLLVFAVLTRSAQTFYHVPHLALGAEMAQDYRQRSTLFAFSTVLSISAIGLTSLVAYGVFFPTTPEFDPGLLNREAYKGFSTFFAVLSVLAIVLCCFGTRGEIPHLRKTGETVALSLASIIDQFGSVFRNSSFRAIFFGMFLSTLAVSVEAVLTPFMGIHFWGLTTEKMLYLPLASMIGLFCGFPLVPLFTRLFDKKYTLMLPALFISINTNLFVCLRLLEVPWFPDNDSEIILPLLMLRYFLSGLALPLVFATLNSMFGDIADEVELTTGQRREGVIFATRSFTSKATAAVGTLIGGVVLDVINFPSQAKAGSIAEDVVWKLGLTEGPLTSIFTIVGVLFYARYKIDQSRHREIRSTIAAKQSS